MVSLYLGFMVSYNQDGGLCFGWYSKQNISYMIPGCHSVVTSWDYVGVGCAYVVLASSWLWSLVFCWGLAIAPQTPYRRNNKRARLSLHQKPWVTKAGGRECGRHIL